MFDLMVTGCQRSSRRAAVALILSWAVHAFAIGLLIAFPLLYASKELPHVPDAILAFVAVAPAPPPAPPVQAAMKPAAL